MFYCQKCQSEKEWPLSITQSLGKCELCGEIAMCSDVPSPQLPKVKLIEPNYEDILKRKIEHYGETKAAYQFAAEEYAQQYHLYKSN